MASVRLKQIRRIKYLKGMRSKLPDIQKVLYDYLDKKVPGVQAFLDLDDSEVEDTWRIMGKKPEDYETAKRVVALKNTFTNAPLTERIAYDWLTQNGVGFIYQGGLFGGRTSKGGILPDLVIRRGGIAWPCHGEYWHSYAINQGKDAIQNKLMLGQYVSGIRIQKVCTLWERDIYTKRPQIFELGLAGISLRGD